MSDWLRPVDTTWSSLTGGAVPPVQLMHLQLEQHGHECTPPNKSRLCCVVQVEGRKQRKNEDPLSSKRIASNAD